MTVKTEGPFHFVKQSLPHRNVEVIKTKNDIGVVFRGNSVTVDRNLTEEMLDNWLSSWKLYIDKEKRFCENHKIDLILSDITPQIFIVSDKLNIPGVAISNFTWHYIFYNLFGETPETEQIRHAYQHADLAFVLPFNEDMSFFRDRREVGLVSREITVDRYDMRRKVGVSDDELLVYIGVGRSFNPSFMRNIEKIDVPDIKFLVSSNAELPFNNVIRIPGSETETQNYIGMCDLIVSKTGYSTVSEAIRAKIPMFLLKRNGFKEDELIGNTIEKLGIGRLISEEAFIGGKWVHELHSSHRYRMGLDALDGRFKRNGASEIIDFIKGVVS